MRRPATQLWKIKVDDHAMARITGAPTYHNGRLYVPVSSTEEVPGGQREVPVLHLPRQRRRASTPRPASKLWKTYMIAEEPKIVGKNAIGTPIWKPAGAAIWTSPTIDVERNRIYVATGNAYTQPAAATSDAVVALDLTSGKILWTQQVTPNDAFVIGCKPGVGNCPDDVGPDYDFGNSPILRTLPGGRRVLTLGQKSGMVYGMAPDDNGKILWQMRAGKGGALGGIEWGSAADERNIYVPVSDVLQPSGGSGRPVRVRSRDRQADLAHASAAAELHDVARLHGRPVSGDQRHSRRRVLRARSTGTCAPTRRPTARSSGSSTRCSRSRRSTASRGRAGRSTLPGPVIAGGMVLTNSGYGQWRGTGRERAAGVWAPLEASKSPMINHKFQNWSVREMRQHRRHRFRA